MRRGIGHRIRAAPHERSLLTTKSAMQNRSNIGRQLSIFILTSFSMCEQSRENAPRSYLRRIRIGERASSFLGWASSGCTGAETVDAPTSVMAARAAAIRTKEKRETEIMDLSLFPAG